MEKRKHEKMETVEKWKDMENVENQIKTVETKTAGKTAGKKTRYKQ